MSATSAPQAEFQDFGKPQAQPSYSVDLAGNPLIPGVAQTSSTVSAFSGNAAALTSATDYPFKWGPSGTTQVNHLMIQNNSGATLNWELDATATAGSPTLANGSTVFLDVQTSTLHLLQTGTPAVNGTSSGNIVVRGWL